MSIHLVKKIIFFIILLKSIYAEKDINGTILLAPQDRLNGISIQDAFGKSKDHAVRHTVRMLRNNKLIALGAIIHPSGYILTKASSCVGAREAQTSAGEKYPLRIKKRFEDADLAIYKLISDGEIFPAVDWDFEGNHTEGSWVLSAHPSLEEIRVGIASGKPRSIGREGGVMGVILVTDRSKVGGVKISEVVPQAAAYRAGLLEGDIITHADERRVKNQDSLIKIISKKDPGDVVRIRAIRREENNQFIVTLGHRSVTFDLFNRNLQMSGPVSKRKDNFPIIIQHDLPLGRESMGGPIFNLNGKCIGLNIARVDRVTIYALPATYTDQVIESFINKIQ